MQLLPLRTCLVAAALGVASLFVSLPAQAGDSYSYDELGNVKQISNEQGTRTYTYDEINRLKTEVGVTGARTHSYDANSNRTSDGAPSPTSATFSANSNRLATINGSAVILDANGNVTNDGVYTYTWNDAGQLSILRAVGNPISAYYYYDYRNRRTRKVTTAVAPQGVQTVVYHYDQSDHLIGESLLNATPLRTYVWLGDTPTAVIEHAAVSNPPRTLYLQVDHLGSPRRAKDAAGVVQWSWDSDGYGRTAANEDPDGDGKKTIINLRFPGQYYDQESGLHYNWNRYYSPRLGRYISSDPIGLEGGANTYGYAGGNPLSFIDPLGLRVTATYDHATGNVYIADDSTGAFYTLPAGSGGNPWGDPIPNGDYDILGHPDPDFFRLEPVDGGYGDDTHAATGRDKFRLHKPGRTIGCIAADEKNSWAKARDMIRATKTDTVGVRSKSRNPFAPRTESLIRYGRVTVINSPR